MAKSLRGTLFLVKAATSICHLLRSTKKSEQKPCRVHELLIWVCQTSHGDFTERDLFLQDPDISNTKQGLFGSLLGGF